MGRVRRPVHFTEIFLPNSTVSIVFQKMVFFSDVSVLFIHIGVLMRAVCPFDCDARIIYPHLTGTH
jgi:hypothetical protein